jgi:ornithine cyclodeaminase/alanine dehydrogenase-like protein (mu-crystallin family)
LTEGRASGQASAVTTVRILRRDEVRSALSMAACIDAVEAAFAAYSAGEAELPGVIHLDVPEGEGEIHVKAGHLHGSPAYAIKVASGFYRPRPPAIDGLVLVFDATTGAPLAFLLDGGYLTDLRTGAAGGVVARWLAPDPVERLAVIGTGIQARRQVEALRCVREVGEVRVWGRSAEQAKAAAEELRAEPATTVEEAVAGADVVVTCTASTEPLVRSAWIEPGAHITAVGSDGVGKQELDPELLRRADVVVADSREQCLRLGELQHAPEVADQVVELGQICAGAVPGRTDQGQLTIADLTGVGVQDVAAANAVLANARDAGATFEL